MPQYQVQAGDNWAGLAGKLLGDQRQFGNLIQANPGSLMLHPGDVINIPDAPGVPGDLTGLINALKGIAFPGGGNMWQGHNGAAPTGGGAGYNPNGGGGGGSGDGNAHGSGRGVGTQGALGSGQTPSGPQSVPDAATQGVAGYIQAHQQATPTTGMGYSTYLPSLLNGAGLGSAPTGTVPADSSLLPQDPFAPNAFNPLGPGGVGNGPMTPGMGAPGGQAPNNIGNAAALLLRGAMHAHAAPNLGDYGMLTQTPPNPALYGPSAPQLPPPPGTNWMYGTR